MEREQFKYSNFLDKRYNDKRYNSFSNFLKNRFGKKVYKVSVNAGFTCPNRDGTKGRGGCIYCQPETLHTLSFRQNESIEEQLSHGIDYIKKRHKAEGFITYLQNYSNTYAPLKTLRDIYYRAVDHPDVLGLAVSTRPDTVDKDIIDLLSEINREKFVWVEYGLQSANNATLEYINRKHTVEEFLSACNMTAEMGIKVCAHIIIGLPGETRDDIIKTARLLSGLSIWGVKIHHMQVYKGSPLETLYNNGKIKALTLEEYISLVIDFIEHLSPDTIVHRLVGDAPKRFLIAPRWGDKLGAIRKINRRMELKGTFQGAKVL